MTFIENRLFDEINVGDCAALERTLTEQDITLFAVMSGDINPAHVDPEYAMGSRFREVIGHGMWSGALISTVLGTEFPGPGTIYLGQNLRFRRPVKVGDTITVKVTAREKDAEKGKVILDTECVNQDGEVVVSGTAEVIAPKEKIRRPRIHLPEVHLDDKEQRFRYIMGRVKARKLAPVVTAIVYPADAESLAGTAAAAEQGAIVPILVGPERAIREAAEAAGVDLKGFAIRPAESSQEAVAVAIRMARDGEVQGIMNGSSPAEELIGQVVSATKGLRTDRRISHVHALDIPDYAKPLFVTELDDQYCTGALGEARDLPERHRSRALAANTSAEGRSACGGRNHQSQDGRHDPCGDAVQDGRAGPDHRRHSRWPVDHRPCGVAEGHRAPRHPLGGRRPGRHSPRSGPRVREHDRQAAFLACRRTLGRNRSRRAGADRADGTGRRSAFMGGIGRVGADDRADDTEDDARRRARVRSLLAFLRAGRRPCAQGPAGF